MSIFILSMILKHQADSQVNNLSPGRAYVVDGKTIVLLVFENDKWFGKDKIVHFVCGGALETAFELTKMKSQWSLVATSVLALAYEWYDMERGVGFSYKDAIWSISGAVTSYLINKYVFKR